MKYLRVKYLLCGTETTVEENFVDNYEYLTLQENNEEWVFWSPDPKQTPECERKIQQGCIYRVDSWLRQKEAVAGYYRARILLIRDSKEEIDSVLKGEAGKTRIRTTVVPKTSSALPPKKKALTKKAIKEAVRSTALNQLIIPGSPRQEAQSPAISVPSSTQKQLEEMQMEIAALRTEVGVFQQKERVSSEKDEELQKARDKIQELNSEVNDLLRKNQVLHEKLDKMMEERVQLYQAKVLDLSSITIPSKHETCVRSSTPVTSTLNVLQPTAIIAGTSSMVSSGAQLLHAIPAVSDSSQICESMELSFNTEVQDVQGFLDECERTLAEQSAHDVLKEQTTTNSVVSSVHQSVSSTGAMDGSALLRPVAVQGGLAEVIRQSSQTEVSNREGMGGSAFLRPVVAQDVELQPHHSAPSEGRRTVSEDQFNFISRKCKMGSAGDSLFVRQLAEILWERSVLAQRSVTGNACINKADSNAYPECTPYKKEIISSLMSKRLDLENISDHAERRKRICSIRRNLNGKIKSIRPFVSSSSSSQPI